MQNTTNVFAQGMTSDMHPLTTSQQEYTDALNATLITFNGNEMMMQNDMGNTKIQDTKTGNVMGLREGFIPVGIKEHGGIMYIASVNKEGEGEIGTIPSPVIRYNAINKYAVEAKDNTGAYISNLLQTQINTLKSSTDLDESPQYKLSNFTLQAGEKFTVFFPEVGIDLSDVISEQKDKKFYKINLYSQIEQDVIKLDTSKINHNDSTEPYWFYARNGYQDDKFESFIEDIRIKDELTGSHNLIRYPNISNGYLMYSIEKENIDSFQLAIRDPQKAKTEYYSARLPRVYWNSINPGTDIGIENPDSITDNTKCDIVIQSFDWTSYSGVTADRVEIIIKDSSGKIVQNVNNVTYSKSTYSEDDSYISGKLEPDKSKSESEIQILNIPSNDWYTLEAVYYYNEWIKPIGTYTLKFNPYVQDVLTSKVQDATFVPHDFNGITYIPLKRFLDYDYSDISITQRAPFGGTLNYNDTASILGETCGRGSGAQTPTTADFYNKSIYFPTQQSTSIATSMQSVKAWNAPDEHIVYSSPLRIPVTINNYMLVPDKKFNLVLKPYFHFTTSGFFDVNEADLGNGSWLGREGEVYIKFKITHSTLGTLFPSGEAVFYSWMWDNHYSMYNCLLNTSTNNFTANITSPNSTESVSYKSTHVDYYSNKRCYNNDTSYELIDLNQDNKLCPDKTSSIILREDFKNKSNNLGKYSAKLSLYLANYQTYSQDKGGEFNYVCEINSDRFEQLKNDPYIQIEIIEGHTKMIRNMFEPDDIGETPSCIPFEIECKLYSQLMEQTSSTQSSNNIKASVIVERTITYPNTSPYSIVAQLDLEGTIKDVLGDETVKLHNATTSCNIDTSFNYANLRLLPSEDFLKSADQPKVNGQTGLWESSQSGAKGTPLDAKDFYKIYNLTQKSDYPISGLLQKKQGKNYIALARTLDKTKSITFIVEGADIDPNEVTSKLSTDSNSDLSMIYYAVFPYASQVKISGGKVANIGIYIIDENVDTPLLQAVLPVQICKFSDKFKTNAFELGDEGINTVNFASLENLIPAEPYQYIYNKQTPYPFTITLSNNNKHLDFPSLTESSGENIKYPSEEQLYLFDGVLEDPKTSSKFTFNRDSFTNEQFQNFVTTPIIKPGWNDKQESIK